VPTAPAAVPRSEGTLAPPPEDYVVVRFRDEVPDWRRPGLSAAKGAPGYRPARFAPFARVEVPPGMTAADLVARFQADPEVLWAEQDAPCRALFQGTAPGPPFNDPLLPRQWTYQRINLLPALTRSPRQGEGVVVAVIDTGVAFGSGPSFPSRRGLDLEGTSFAPGWDFVDQDPFPFDEGSALDRNDPLSIRFGHGTFAASQIAAVANNGIAGIGVAPRTTIMPLRALNTRGTGRFSDIAEAIHFAANHGARVINMSLGGREGTIALQEAVRAARRVGVVLVAAAGNEAREDDFPGDVSFPARYAEVLAVGATDFHDRRASYSSHGPGLDLMAPAGDTFDEVSPGILDAALSTSFLHNPRTGQTTYGAFWSTGTSFAAPQVAGTAALLISLGVRDADGVERLLLDTTRDLGSPGFDTHHGWGLLDAFDAHRGLGLTF
jgi:serine protease